VRLTVFFLVFFPAAVAQPIHHAYESLYVCSARSEYEGTHWKRKAKKEKIVKFLSASAKARVFLQYEAFKRFVLKELIERFN
jgi:hypothetical protein